MPDNYSNPTFCLDQYSAINQNRLGHGVMNEKQPRLQIVNQPVSKFRFRYSSEKPGSHGTLVSSNALDSSKKEYITVKVVNYVGRVKIRASLVSANHQMHVHQLVGSNCNNGVCEMEVSPENGMKAVFQSMGIEHRAKKEVVEIIYVKKLEELKRRMAEIDQSVEDAMKRQAEEESKHLNLNVVCIRFDAISTEYANIVFEPVFSIPINNLKSAQSGALKIVRMDSYSGVCNGGDQIFLLCEKVKKNDVQIQFYEDGDKGEKIWLSFGKFTDKDVHRQFAIVFMTPPYKDPNLKKPVKVKIQLVRPSDQDCSEPVEFVYKPKIDDCIEGHRKRQRVEQCYEDVNLDRSSGTNSSSQTQNNSSQVNQETMHQTHSYPTYQFTSMEDPNLSNWIFPNDLLNTASLSSPRGFDEADSPMSLPGSSELSLFSGDVDEWLNIEKNVERDSISFGQGASMPVNSKPKELKGGATSVHKNVKMKNQGSGVLSKQTMNSYMHLDSYAKTGNVVMLLKSLRYIIGVEDHNGNNAIFHAILHKNISEAKMMIESVGDLLKGKIINHYNRRRQTALHLSVLMNEPSLIHALLKQKCSIEVADFNGNSAFHLAAKLPTPDCLQALCEATQSREERRNVLNQKNYEGLAPLHLAVLFDRVDYASILLHCNANVNIQEGKCGKYPIHMSIERRNYPLMRKLLQDDDLNINAQTFNGDTPLHYAVSQMEDEQIIAELLQKGANPTICNFDYQSNSEYEGADAECSDNVGISPRALAVGDEQIMKLLTMNMDGISDRFNELQLIEQDSRKSTQLSAPEFYSSENSKSTSIHNDEGYYSKEFQQSLVDDLMMQKLFHLFDPPSEKWQMLASLLDFDSRMGQLCRSDSPTKDLLKMFLDEGRQLNELCNLFEALDLPSAKSIIEEVIHKSN